VVITRLTPHFAARIDGVDITRPLDEPAWKEIRAALDEHHVLVFSGQLLDDDT
jgi:alpha-ketoglutarate-dependent taurine dioxygenase